MNASKASHVHIETQHWCNLLNLLQLNQLGKDCINAYRSALLPVLAGNNKLCSLCSEWRWLQAEENSVDVWGRAQDQSGASQTFPVHLLRLGAHVDNDVRMRDPDLFPTPYVPLCQPVLIYLPLNIFARLHCANTGWSMQVSIVRVCIFTIANGFGPAHWVLFESLKWY